MSHATLWILDHAAGDQLAILWPHNLHVATDSFRIPGLAEGDLLPMGVLLESALGDDYIAIGGSFSRGLFPHDLPPGDRVFERPATDVMDGALARVGLSSFILDLRRAETDPAAWAWLAQPREWTAQDAGALLTPQIRSISCTSSTRFRDRSRRLWLLSGFSPSALLDRCLKGGNHQAWAAVSSGRRQRATSVKTPGDAISPRWLEKTS